MHFGLGTWDKSGERLWLPLCIQGAGVSAAVAEESPATSGNMACRLDGPLLVLHANPQPAQGSTASSHHSGRVCFL